MSDPKGKGKMTAESTKKDESSELSAINNLINNVASSASGLARSAFAAPSSNELSNTASSGLIGSGKGQSSSSSTGVSPAYAGAFKPTTSTFGASQAQSSQPQGFRTAQEHVQAAEQEFSSFLDGIPSMEPEMPALDISTTALPPSYELQQPRSVDDHPHPASRHVNPFSDEEFIRYSAHSPAGALHPSQNESSDTTYCTVADAQAHDGADVLAILDTFKPEEMDYFEPQTIEQEVEDWHLTPQQYNLAKKLADELHLRPAPDHPANMVPRAFQDGEKAEYLPEEYAQDSYGQFGKSLPVEEAREKWAEQWEGVLNRYQDEVWGGMAPLVKQATQEIKEIVKGSEGRQPKALARLRLVLGHISGVQQQSQLETEKQRQRENELIEAAEREPHNLPVNDGTWGPSNIHAQRMEESARISSNPYPTPLGPPAGVAMEDAWERSNYGPQVYMQPAEAAQAKEYKTWFENAVTGNER